MPPRTDMRKAALSGLAVACLAVGVAGCGEGGATGPTDGASSDSLATLVVAESIRVRGAPAALLVQPRGAPLLIPVGECEHTLLEVKLYELGAPRPVASDLFRAFADSLGYGVTQIALEISEQDSLTARIVLEGHGEIVELASTPGDALAIAVAVGVDVVCSSEVVSRHAAGVSAQPGAGKTAGCATTAQSEAGGAIGSAGRPAQSGDRPVRVRVQAIVGGIRALTLLLGEVDGERALPILVGYCQGLAIYGAANGIDFPDLQVYDLLSRMLAETGTTMTHARVTAIEEHTYYGEIGLERGGRRYLIDARPSDAVALSQRTEAPIEVMESLLQEPGTEDN